MNITILISIIVYFGLLVVAAISFKRSYKVDYDRKSLIAGLLLVVAAVFIWFFADLSDDPTAEESTTNKVYWLILFTLIGNVVIQTIIWLFYVFIRKNDLLRIPRFMFDIIGSILLIAIILFGLKYIFGTNLSGLLVTSTVLSAIIGLSLQDTLTNLFAGVSLQMEAPFNLDDWVNLGGYEGKVVSQNWRTLTLLTRENHRVSLPNKTVAEEKIVNYSRPTKRQIHSFFVELDYSHPPNEVKRILREILTEIKEVDIDQVAYPYVVSYEASGIKYCLKYWINDYGDVIAIQDIVLTRLWYKLERHNIKIPYSISEVHMSVMSDSVQEQQAEKERNYRLSLLKKQSWLKDMDEDQLMALSHSTVLACYGENDDLVQEGAEGDSMFIITKGRAKVLIHGPNDAEVLVADKSAGEFFGEMSLLTGDPRSATVRAIEDMEVLVIDKGSFTNVLAQDKGILQLFFDALGSNQGSLNKIIEDEKNNANIPIQSARERIFKKIISYLDL